MENQDLMERMVKMHKMAVMARYLEVQSLVNHASSARQDHLDHKGLQAKKVHEDQKVNLASKERMAIKEHLVFKDHLDCKDLLVHPDRRDRSARLGVLFK